MNQKCKKVSKILVGVLFFLSTMFIALYLNSVSFALENNTVSGYIKPDFSYRTDVESEILSGFKVEIMELSNVSVLTSSTGFFEFNGVPENSKGYTLKISKAGFLQRIIKNIPVNGSIQINHSDDPIKLWAGDILRDGIQDNAVNLCDIIAVARFYNSSAGDSRYYKDLDLDKDGNINMTDIIIIANHFNCSPDDYTNYSIYKFPVAAIATNNKTVEVTFNMKLNTAVSGDKFSITGLSITGAQIKNDGTNRTVIVNTTVQTVGVIYTLKCGSTGIQFGGVNIPAIEDIKINGLWANYISDDRTSVKVSWIPPLDYSVLSYLNAKAYDIHFSTIDGHNNNIVSVTDLKADSYQIDGLDPSKNYRFFIYIRSENIKGIPSDFVIATTDAIKPEVLTTEATSNTNVCISFDKEMDKGNAENISNYSIPGLTVLNAELDLTGKTVTLTTSNQSVGTIYRIIMSNITDKNGNMVDCRDAQLSFGGIPDPERKKPRLISAISIENKKVRVIFDKQIDKTKAEDISNYTISGLSVLKAEQGPAPDSVTLITSAQEAGVVYKLTVLNITDNTGNIIDPDFDEYLFGGVPPDTTRPSLISVSAIDSTTVKVRFNEPMNEDSARAISSYYFGPELGYPTIVYKSDELPEGSSWILKTEPLKAAMYTLVVSNVTDTSGNVINPDRDEAKFIGVDTIKPCISAAIALNRNTIKISFSKPLKISTLSKDAFTFSLKSGIDDSTARITGGNVHPDSMLISDDRKSVTVGFINRYMTSGAIYSVTAADTIQDESGNAIGLDNNNCSFAGLGMDNPAPYVTSAIAVNNQTLKLTFSEPIILTSDLDTADISINPSFTAVLNNCILSDDKTNLILYFKGAGENDKFSAGRIYTITINDSGKNKIKNELETQNFSENDYDAKASFAGTSTMVTSPIIGSIMAVNNNTIDIIFNQSVEEESIEYLSSQDFLFSKYGMEISFTAGVALVRFEGSSGSKIRIFLNTNEYNPSMLTPGSVYKLSITPGKITNLNGLVMNVEGSSAPFAMISTQNPPPKIENAYKINSTQIKVVFSEKISGLQADGSDFEIMPFSTITSAAIDTNDLTGKSVILTLSEGSNSPGVRTLFIAQPGIKDEAGVDSVDINSKVDFAF